MSDLLNILWSRVESAARAMSGPLGRYGWGEDDDGMKDAEADDLLAWADDVADRLGFDESDFRAALLDYTLARDEGGDLDPEDRAAFVAELTDTLERERDTWRAIADRTGGSEDRAKMDAAARALEDVGGWA